MKQIRNTALGVCLCVLAGTAYLVQKGDTLWDLSGQFLGNPFSWPDLWENNRHIQDPHWIYPGDSLCLPGSDGACTGTVAAAEEEQQPSAPCHSAADSSLPVGVKPACHPGDRDADFQSQLGGLKKPEAEKNLADSTLYFYHKKDAPKLFNIYYQRLAPVVQTVAEHRADTTWRSVRTGEKKEPLLHTLEHEVVLGYGKKQISGLKAGDLAEIWSVGKLVLRQAKGNGHDTVAMLRLSAIGRINAIGDTLSRASIVQTFSPLDLSKAKSRPFAQPAVLEVLGYEPVTSVKYEEMATIRSSIDPILIIGQYSYVMVDKGNAEGYRSGSGVAFWEKDTTDSSLPPRLLGKGIVARSSAHESAILVREIYSHTRRLAEGHKVSLTHQPVVK